LGDLNRFHEFNIDNFGGSRRQGSRGQAP
jgi:hypothetical protein